MAILWSSRFIIYFGLTINLSHFGDNLVLNFTAMGISELIASLLAAPIKRKFTRKISMQISLLFCSLSCLLIEMSYFKVVLALGKPNFDPKILVSKFSITVFYGILVTYTAEIYPTNLRSQAYGTFLTAGRY
jgi:predicted MFS family arabinose efflux permease